MSRKMSDRRLRQGGYERPPANKRRVVNKPPPRGRGELTSTLQGSLARFACLNFRSALSHIGVQLILEVSRIGSRHPGGRGHVRRRGSINFCPCNVRWPRQRGRRAKQNEIRTPKIAPARFSGFPEFPKYKNTTKQIRKE
jgi:hypothetical protein